MQRESGSDRSRGHGPGQSHRIGRIYGESGIVRERETVAMAEGTTMGGIGYMERGKGAEIGRENVQWIGRDRCRGRGAEGGGHAVTVGVGVNSVLWTASGVGADRGRGRGRG